MQLARIFVKRWLGCAALGWLLMLAAGNYALQAQETASAPPEKDIFIADVAWSPDGKQLAYSAYTGGMPFNGEKWGVYLVNVDGTGSRLLVENAVTVSWSPDGKKLAFGSGRNSNWDVYTIAVDGTQVTRLTTDKAGDRLPAWSPKGDKIAFCSERDGNHNLYLMNADGSNVMRLTQTTARDFNPGWSPDGRTIVFYREKGDHKDQVFVVSADGKKETPITQDEAHNIYPAFLPNGRIGYCTSSKDRKNVLMCIDASGTNRNEMPSVSTFFARWSPDGKQLAFITGSWPKTSLFVASADGTKARKIVN